MSARTPKPRSSVSKPRKARASDSGAGSSRTRAKSIALGAPRQARSVATRQSLLAATIACIGDVGYARTTTTEICKRAGVSQGALFKHFPDKAQLLGAATQQLFDGLVDAYRDMFVQVANRPDRLGAALELLWGVFNDAPLQVAFELYVAARTDADLRATLRPVLLKHRQNLRTEAAAFFPEAAKHIDFDSTIDGIMAAMQGAALSGMVLPQPASSQGELAFIDRAARAEFLRALTSLAQPGGAVTPRGRRSAASPEVTS